jgi:mono/diheme cytochrome c family protein
MFSIHRRIALVLFIIWRIVSLPCAAAPPDPAASASLAQVSQEQLSRGNQLYVRYCFMCHQAGGQGAPPTFPPLSQSDFLAADKERSIRILITGLKGAIKVRNQIYDGLMPPAPYDDAQLADVLTFVHNSFGNSNGPVRFAPQSPAPTF